MERYQQSVIPFLSVFKVELSALHAIEFNFLKDFKEILLSLKILTKEAIIQIDNCQKHITNSTFPAFYH